MPRILYDHLLTESGFDLLTESGDDLVLREIGIAGDATVSGGLPGVVVGNGRVIAVGSGTVIGGICPALLTESGTDLLTESGEPLDLARINGGSVSASGQILEPALVGTGAVAGQPGQVTGTGRVIGIEPPVELPHSGSSFFTPTVITIRGHGATHGQPGCVAGRGHLTLVGKGKAGGQPGSAAGCGHLTLVGTAAVIGTPASATGHGTSTLTGNGTAAGQRGTTTIHARTDPYYRARQEDDFWLMAA